MSLLSSGNLAADRRYLWAQASRREGELAAAADLFAQALECAPGWAAASFALGECRAALGDSDGAIAAFRSCLAAAPDDPFGAGLRLARLTGGEAPVGMPDRYVAQLFDDYADRFDDHLVGALNYAGPAILRAALAEAATGLGRPMRFDAVLDLGCGTGLMAAELAGLGGAIDGIDLSPRMVARAAATGHYRRLETGEVISVMQAACAPAAYDLVIAADVLVYIGALEPLAGAVARVMKPAGLFAFTVQAGMGEGYQLGPDMRFAHSAAYLRRLAAEAGWSVVHLKPAVTRTDAGRDVPGLVAIFAGHPAVR